MATNTYEVIIIGGSYAGLSAAMALGRSLRKVLLIDSGKPCNRFTPYAHNFLTQDGIPPSQIAQKAKAQVQQYPSIDFLTDKAVHAEKSAEGFTLTTENGGAFEAKKLIFATGIRDILPEVPGFAACWGKSIVHCPYCHGYEFKGKKTAILAKAEKALHLLPLIKNLTEEVSLLISDPNEYTDEQLRQLKAHKIPLLTENIKEVVHTDGKMTTLLFEDGSSQAFDALYAALPFEQHSHMPEALGCQLNELGYLEIEHTQKTTVEGVYACGDNSSMMRALSNAVYTGNVAGAMINMELAQEQFLIA
ncbi:NAD(P)/FAD-dependent oxidoreductase [Mesonia sp. K7]|uniref:NAD(P)/FAD-dependent oxidoreductase n=1 Tax=Mesonia sp. K7 TaxID=2218606 RepID=UPI000DA8AD99|nr:NAD(P)/FAD-dependent oxidoreductase [Mesonia sp. K7]PZD76706.1 NAD(P)/FAD-dependent oxidoreductase [Mesonia sp. K7]